MPHRWCRRSPTASRTSIAPCGFGYNWSQGPFELIDAMGAAWFADKLRAEQREVPPLLARAAEAGGFYRIENGVLQQLAPDGRYRDVVRPPGVLLLSDIKRKSKPVKRNGAAALWDIGEGVFCLEFTSKMNAIDQDTLAMLKTGARSSEGDRRQGFGHPQ
jgi:3-hydroxyacyl-CoA dehydrogenase